MTYLKSSTATDRMAAENRGDNSGDALKHTDRQHQTAHRHLMVARETGIMFILVTFDEIACSLPAEQVAN